MGSSYHNPNLNKGETILAIRQKLNISRKEFSDALGLNLLEEKKLILWENNQEEIPEDIFIKITSFPTKPPFSTENLTEEFTIIDLFAGIGGMRMGFQKWGGKTVFSSEWDKFAQKTYRINFNETPKGDITLIDEQEIPDHDILLAGFPCQPFSKAGLKMGFEDTRGTMFFEIARILKAKQPKAFLLENVKNLKAHNKGETLKTILEVLEELNYYVPKPEILNSYDFGSIQNRKRIFIVGFNKNYLPENYHDFQYPKGQINQHLKLGDMLDDNVLDKYTISDKLYEGYKKRQKPSKKGNKDVGLKLFNQDSKYINTIVAKYYTGSTDILIEQKDKNPRMLTPRECARLQGFPENFIIPVSNNQAYIQLGNTVSIKVVEAIAKNMIDYMKLNKLL